MSKKLNKFDMKFATQFIKKAFSNIICDVSEAEQKRDEIKRNIKKTKDKINKGGRDGKKSFDPKGR